MSQGAADALRTCAAYHGYLSVQRAVFEGCSSYGGGGAAYLASTLFVIANSVFRNNYVVSSTPGGDMGGALLIQGALGAAHRQGRNNCISRTIALSRRIF